jgi:alkanesulfonate monooxygenase SsuD/methylene tetrahydromethanopterin reductase-like flavin-dependent oxidoreductase (luciferase family)
MMAQYAEMANLIAPRDELPRKLEVLAAHCADMGRDPSTINKTGLFSVIQGPDAAAADRLRDDFLAARGMDWSALDEGTRTALMARMVIGDPDSVAEQVRSLIDLGLDGICMNLPANGHDPEAVAATVANVAKAVG